jgi:WD40 repeat protein
MPPEEKAMYCLNLLLLVCLTTPPTLPKLEKVWRIDVGGQSTQLHLTQAGQLYLNVTTHLMDGDKLLKKYDAVKSLCPEGKLVPVFKFPDFARGFALTPDGKRCVILKGYNGLDLEVWDVAEGKALCSTKNETFKVHYSYLALNRSGQEGLVLHTGEVQQFSVDDLSRITTHKEPLEDQLHRVALFFTTANQPRAVYVRNIFHNKTPGELIIWDFHDQRFVRRINLDSPVKNVGITRDLQFLYQSDPQGKLLVWKVDDTEQQPNYIFNGHTKPVYAVAIDLQKRLIVTTSEDQSLMTWCSDTQQPLSKNIFPKMDKFMSIAFAPDGKHLYAHANTVESGPVNRKGFVTLFKLPSR